MNIGTRLKSNEKGKRIRFRALLIITGITLSLLFSMVYLGISIHNIEETTKISRREEMSVDHRRFCDSISECAYQVEKIETFVKRNGLTRVVGENLNLVEKDVAKKRLEMSENRLRLLSVSSSIVESFVVLGRDFNQKNLYFDVKEGKLLEENFPTADVLRTSGLEGKLLANWGNIGKVDFKQLQESKEHTIENMVRFLENSYFTCDYVDETLVIIKFDSEYFQERFVNEQDSALIIYQSLKKPTLYVGADYEFALDLMGKLSYDKEFFEDDNYYYNCTYNLYGNMSAVTIREKENTVSENIRELLEWLYLVFIVAMLVPIITFVVTYLVSQKMFERLNRFYRAIKKQSQMHNFTLIELEDKTRGFKKITFSNRIFIALLSSCVISLVMTSIIFQSAVNEEVKGYAHSFADSVSERYENQYKLYYDRYDGLSTVVAEKFIGEFKGEDFQTNYALIKEFEESFYYESSFLPGYSYAFIVNQNKNVLYQTMLSSQTQISNNLINQALTQAENYSCEGVFVTVNDFLTGEETVAFVKKLYADNHFIGNIIIVLDGPSLPESYMDGRLHVSYFTVQNRDDILSEKSHITSERSGMEKCLGICAVAIDYGYYAEQIKEAQTDSFLIMTIMFLFCLATAFILKLLLIRPFNMLMNHMNLVPKGIYRTIPERGTTDEIDEIATAYNHMIVRLEELVDESIQQATKQQELELLQAQTEFRMLQQQINPHFLFNTLEIINLTAINNEEEDISNIVKSLSYILRYAIGKTAMVKVKHEIEALEAYIEIQRHRFGDSFSIEVELDKTLFQCYMIKFIIQPLVENAIVHGMKKTSGGGEIKISLSCYDEGIEFCVSDNGVGMSEEKLGKLREAVYNPSAEYTESQNSGIGLKNVYRRIKLYYGDRGQFIINSIENQGTMVVIRIPFEPDEDML